MLPRHAAQVDGGDALPTDELPPWLAVERRIMVKREAPALLRSARHTRRPAQFAAVCAKYGVAFGCLNRPEDEDDDEMALSAATALTAQLDIPL